MITIVKQDLEEELIQLQFCFVSFPSFSAEACRRKEWLYHLPCFSVFAPPRMPQRLPDASPEVCLGLLNWSLGFRV